MYLIIKYVFMHIRVLRWKFRISFLFEMRKGIRRKRHFSYTTSSSHRHSYLQSYVTYTYMFILLSINFESTITTLRIHTDVQHSKRSCVLKLNTSHNIIIHPYVITGFWINYSFLFRGMAVYSLSQKLWKAKNRSVISLLCDKNESSNKLFDNFRSDKD